MLQKFKFLSIVFFSALSIVSFAHADGLSSPVEVRAVQEEVSVQPGKSFWLAVHFEMDEGWHIYWKHPGDAGFAPSIEWTLPEGYQVEKTDWPYPESFSTGSLSAFGYEKEAIFLVKISSTKEISIEESNVRATVRWLACDDSTCLPGEKTIDLPLSVATNSPELKNEHQPLFERARSKIPLNPYLSIENKNDVLAIALPPILSSSPTHTRFFPEGADIVDSSVDPLLTEREEGGHTLLLTPHSSGPKTIKGVALFTSPEGEKTAVAISIEQPAQTTNSSTLIAANETGSSENSGSSTSTLQGIATAIFLAFVGGMILNLMPCVLPVLSLKVLSFVKMANQDRSQTLKQGLAFSLGVLVSFWVLAGALLALQAYGSSVGWGFQLQEPLFVAILAAILFILGLSLFGVFEVGAIFSSWAGQKQMKTTQSTGYFGSFMSGILATAVATPCTGPFLGSAIGFAITLPPHWSLLIFTSLGMGMAFPYLLLAAYPSLLRFLPKPGNWMVAFKELMGFFMVATVLWLIWVFGAQTSSLGIFLLISSFFFIALACWILGKWGTPVRKRSTRLFSYALTSACFILSGMIIMKSTAPSISAYGGGSSHTESSSWEEFSPERVEELRKEGTPVFIDFTAKWCLICQANHMALSTKEVEDAFREKGVVRMKADWTKRSEIITAELKKQGRNSVPLYLYYDSNGEKSVLPQVLTPQIILQYIGE